MGISVQTNYANLVAQNTLQGTNMDLSKSMERLSTGFRINSASDDAAGLQIANRLESQARGMGVASKNAQDAISMMQTAEGAMDEMTNIAFRMQDLATQAANGTASDADRAAMDAEYTELGNELSSIMSNTNFGGQALLDPNAGSFSSGVTFQIGAQSTEQLNVDVSSNLGVVGTTINSLTDAADLQSDLLAARDTAASGGAGVTGTYTDYADFLAQVDAGTATAGDDAIISGLVDTAAAGFTLTSDGTTSTATVTQIEEMGIGSQAGAQNAIDSMSTFVNDLSSTRSQFGATINRLEHTITNLGNMSENIQGAKGRIMDTDFAAESGAMSKSQMLMQSGASMLGATKMVPQLAMSMLG
ncbi:Lateral flagellin [Vibrio sp. SS-MA-C1-2]|uniref:flagellin N-terminal helical domain-containing protein n=1 Tax=Vibrio sp. SS-MA-C1-2 TaxID=2908646 RepID=UPI001F4522AD|nr:flagellin [Vibrio sp. SS-MA-C1-2]UJF18033.1 Lateral flagellin [Vibrio sp. SS-MA-C1-2]